MVRSDAWKQRKCVLDYWAFKDELRLKSRGLVIDDRFKITFYMPMPKSWPKKKQAEMIGKPHQQRPDLDNLVKAFQDCLLKEDSQIWHIEAKKIWSDKGAIEVENMG